MTPNRITRLIAWAKRVDWLLVVTISLFWSVVMLWFVPKLQPQPKPTASIPAIPKVDYTKGDRTKLEHIYNWVLDQEKAKADFERDMKAGRIPRLPGVGR